MAAAELLRRHMRDRASLPCRADKFAALAALLDTDVDRYEDAIETIRRPCPGVANCPASEAAAVEAGERALEWARQVRDPEAIRAEHERLFGSADMVSVMPSVAPYGSMYLGDGSTDVADHVRGLYASMGFKHGVTDEVCLTHVTVELRFMAHLLRRAADGDVRARMVANDFFVDHLYSWAVVFSAATFARSSNPITRFAGLMIEHMLFCEVAKARLAPQHIQMDLGSQLVTPAARM